MLSRYLLRRSGLAEAACRAALTHWLGHAQLVATDLTVSSATHREENTSTPEICTCNFPLSTQRSFSSTGSKDSDITGDTNGDITSPTSTSQTESSSTNGSAASQTLMNALDKLVGAAAEFVEEGKLSEAISVLTEGITVLEGPFPKSTEVGELHNQVSLLLLFSNKAVEAEQHAFKALEITQEVFGAGHVLTAKRLLRLGSILTALGKFEDAFAMLSTAKQILQVDTMKFAVDIAEIDFFTALLKQSAASTPSAVLEHQPELFSSFKILCDNLGGESLTVSIALGQQTRTTLNAIDRDFQVAEAFFKQEVRLLESSGAHSEAVGLVLYKLATFYYAHDLFHDGTAALQQAASVLQNVLPEDHDLLILCKHRQGMLCALGGDHRAATQLLKETQAHYSGLDPNHILSLEAAAGLELARLRELDIVAHASSQEMQDVLRKASNFVEGMTEQIGPNHMLVGAITRRLNQLEYSLTRR